jgi:hypothetical protein
LTTRRELQKLIAQGDGQNGFRPIDLLPTEKRDRHNELAPSRLVNHLQSLSSLIHGKFQRLIKQNDNQLALNLHPSPLPQFSHFHLKICLKQRKSHYRRSFLQKLLWSHYELGA